jgi:hypothetical protein
MAFGDLGPFVLGDDALHLDQQTRLGIVVEWRRVREDDAHVVAGEFLQNAVLVGESPRQTVGRHTAVPGGRAGRG